MLYRSFLVSVQVQNNGEKNEKNFTNDKKKKKFVPVALISIHGVSVRILAGFWVLDWFVFLAVSQFRSLSLSLWSAWPRVHSVQLQPFTLSSSSLSLIAPR